MKKTPDELLLEAENEEPLGNRIKPYKSSIMVLRSKGWSYRKIAIWLTERGVRADYAGVYRVVKNE